MRKIIAVLLTMLILMVAFSGCTQKPEADQPSTGTTEPTGAVTTEPASSGGIVRGGTLKIGKTEDIKTMDPTQTNSKSGDNMIFMQIFEPLITFDEDGNYASRLALSWEVAEDNKSVTLKLREGVKFHDGTDFNAEAVKINLDYFLSEECNHVYRTSDFANVESVDVIDEYTVRVNLTQTDATLLSAFTNISGFIMSPEAIKQGADYLTTHAVGTGPFMLSEYVPGDHVTLEANKNYYEMGEDGKPLPYLDKAIFYIMTDDSVKTVNLQTGDIDMVDYSTVANNVKKLQNTENVTVVPSNYRDTFFLCFNQNDSLLRDVKVRQAVSYAVNRQEIMDVGLEGIGILEYFDSTPDQWFYDDYNPYSYDPEKAKELLKEAGYPNGIEITLSHIAREPDATICQLLQQQLKNSNITLKIESLERDAWINLIRTTRGGQMGIGVIGIQGLDPNQQYNSLLVYNDPQYITDIQELLLSAKNTFNIEERKAIFAQFQKDYLDNAYYVILGQRPRYISFINKVQNFAQFKTGNLNLKYIWLKN